MSNLIITDTHRPRETQSLLLEKSHKVSSFQILGENSDDTFGLEFLKSNDDIAPWLTLYPPSFSSSFEANFAILDPARNRHGISR